MAKRKKRNFTPKFNDVVTFQTKVIRIEEQNTPVGDKFKTVFYCESISNPEGVMCIAWRTTAIKPGCEVDMKGRLKNGVFLVWSIMMKNPRPNESISNQYAAEVKNKIKELKKYQK